MTYYLTSPTFGCDKFCRACDDLVSHVAHSMNDWLLMPDELGVALEAVIAAGVLAVAAKPPRRHLHPIRSRQHHGQRQASWGVARGLRRGVEGQATQSIRFCIGELKRQSPRDVIKTARDLVEVAQRHRLDDFRLLGSGQVTERAVMKPIHPVNSQLEQQQEGAFRTQGLTYLDINAQFGGRGAKGVSGKQRVQQGTQRG